MRDLPRAALDDDFLNHVDIGGTFFERPEEQRAI
jgi:hypothetical protein